MAGWALEDPTSGASLQKCSSRWRGQGGSCVRSSETTSHLTGIAPSYEGCLKGNTPITLRICRSGLCVRTRLQPQGTAGPAQQFGAKSARPNGQLWLWLVARPRIWWSASWPAQDAPLPRWDSDTPAPAASVYAPFPAVPLHLLVKAGSWSLSSLP